MKLKEPDLLSIPKAARATNLPERELRRLVNKALIKVHYSGEQGGRVYVSMPSLREFLHGQAA